MKHFNIFILNDYYIIFLFLIIAVILSMVLILGSYFLIIQNPNSEKLSSYECGYEPYESSRHVFNVNFCLIAIFFLIFDIEMLFLLPWCLNISEINLFSFWVAIDFIFELCVGYFYILYSNSFSW
jgi:NADH-quinone oxidoreductase subunit A